ncbi:MAG: BMP family lipoprotein [Streptosporangiales bacterium]
MRGVTGRAGVAVPLVVAALLATAGCGQKPSGSSEADSSGGGFQACMVLDIGGVDDHSFNQGSWAGMQQAAKHDSDIDVSNVTSGSQNDYVPNLEAQVRKGCGLIIGVGGPMADAVKKVAKKHPDTNFALIDAATGQPNVKGIVYNSAQASFLGGYLAAGMTKTGKVATFGGLPIPPVTTYMDGYWEGVQYYNKVNGTHVKVLGWNENKPKSGTFANSFSDQGKGRQIATALNRQGADIILPLAGATSLGTLAAAKASDGKLNLIWADFDGCKVLPDSCKYFISSVYKNLPDSVAKIVEDAAGGKFSADSYVGTLANGGVDIAPYHQWADRVPAKLKKGVAKAKSDIISGDINITSPTQPK